MDCSPNKKANYRPKFLSDYTPKHSFGTERASKNCRFPVAYGLKKRVGRATGGFDEILDLFPRDQNFAEGVAGLEFPAPNQIPHRFSAAIQGGGGLVDVVKERFNRGGFGGFSGRLWRVVHNAFSCFFAGIGDYVRYAKEFLPNVNEGILEELEESEDAQKTQIIAVNSTRFV